MNKDFITCLNRSLSQVVDASSLSANSDGLTKKEAWCKKIGGPFFMFQNFLVPKTVISKKGHHFREPIFSIPK